MHTTIVVCAASLAILTLALALWTSIQRARSRTVSYHAALAPDSAMAKAQRAHGNAAEYSGLLIGLFLVIGFAYAGRDLGALVQWTVIAITVARWLHAVGFLVGQTLEQPHPLKAIGALVTYLGGLLLAVLAVTRAL